jgi:hypothetical protein
MNKKTIKDSLLSLLTGICLYMATSLLLNPKMVELKATWALFYGDF